VSSICIRNNFAKGFKPNSSIFSLDIRTKADAPSLRVEALAAVTVPFSF
jgi:hypothetical protein